MTFKEVGDKLENGLILFQAVTFYGMDFSTSVMSCTSLNKISQLLNSAALVRGKAANILPGK